MDIFAVAQSIPGAIAINTASLVGYKKAGRLGTVFSTLGMVLPSFFIITIIATFFSKIADLPIVHAVFMGINGAVVVMILLAARRIAKSAIHDIGGVLIMVLTICIVVFTDISPIFLLLAGGLPGVFYYLYKKSRGGYEK